MRFETFAVATAVAALLACSGATTAAQHPRPVDTPTPANVHEVIIYNYKFDPLTLTVPAGATVTWINRDIAPHTATHRSFGDEPFDSGALGHKAVFSHTFKIPGSYAYLCVLHQGMTGTIVVQ